MVQFNPKLIENWSVLIINQYCHLMRIRYCCQNWNRPLSGIWFHCQILKRTSQFVSPDCLNFWKVLKMGAGASKGDDTPPRRLSMSKSPARGYPYPPQGSVNRQNRHNGYDSRSPSPPSNRWALRKNFSTFAGKE